MARLRVLTDRPLPPRRILGAAAMISVGDRDGFSPAVIGALGLALVALATGLPLVVAAFRLPDIDDEDIDGDIDGEGG